MSLLTRILGLGDEPIAAPAPPTTGTAFVSALPPTATSAPSIDIDAAKAEHAAAVLAAERADAEHACVQTEHDIASEAKDCAERAYAHDPTDDSADEVARAARQLDLVSIRLDAAKTKAAEARAGVDAAQAIVDGATGEARRADLRQRADFHAWRAREAPRAEQVAASRRALRAAEEASAADRKATNTAARAAGSPDVHEGHVDLAVALAERPGDWAHAARVAAKAFRFDPTYLPYDADARAFFTAREFVEFLASKPDPKSARAEWQSMLHGRAVAAGHPNAVVHESRRRCASTESAAPERGAVERSTKLPGGRELDLYVGLDP